MFTRLAFFFLSVAAIAPRHVLAVAPKSHGLPHFVRILLRPEAALKLRAPYAMKHVSNPDIQSIVLDSTDDITALLGLSARIHPSRLRPFLPEHSVVFENFREHINPSLFHPKTSVQSLGITDDALLRSSEEKLSRWFTLQFTDSMTPEDAARWCKKSRETIELAEPVYAREICSGPAIFRPNDPMIDTLYALRLMHAFEAWKIVRCDSAIPNDDTMVLADVDAGVDYQHPDLQNAIWFNKGEIGDCGADCDKTNNNVDDDSDGYIDDYMGWDFASGFDGTAQDKGPYACTYPYHGSHTSGIMCATGNNNIGITGVAFGARLMMIKCAVDDASVLDPPIIAGDEGIVFAADHKAKVINNSWGGLERSLAEEDVVNYAYAKGSIIVCAAGNSDLYTDFYPASYEHAFSVSSVDSNAKITSSASGESVIHNEHVAVAAPGVGIISTVCPNPDAPNGYGSLEGTSMATPQVTGALGLMWQHYPGYSNQQVMDRLRSKCDPIASDTNTHTLNGHGLVNIYRAVLDTFAYALHLESSAVVGSSDTNLLRPDETGSVYLTFKNYLDTLSDVRGNIDFIDDRGRAIPADSGHVTITPTGFALGTIPPMGVVQVPTPLSLHVGSQMTPGKKILGRIMLSGSSPEYTGDYAFFEFRVNPGYETLDTNNLSVTFDDKGCIGFRDQLLDNEGKGFYWRNAPPSVGPNARSVLLGGGLLIVRDSTHVVDGLGSYDDNANANYAVRPRMGITRSTPTPFGMGQTIFSSFTDSLADSSSRVGIQVDGNAYALAATAAQNTVIAEYTFSPRNDSRPFTAGLYMDWDISQGGNLDSAFFDKTDSIFYIFKDDQGSTVNESRLPAYPVLGMKLTSHIDAGTSIAYYAINNFPGDAGLQTESPFTSENKWSLFQKNKSIAGPGDVAVVLGVRNMSFTSGSPKLVYTMGFGLTQADVRLSLLNTQAIMEGRPISFSVKSVPSTQSGLQIWPDPVTNGARIRIAELSPDTKLKVSTWDALGRCVLPTESLDNGGRIDFSSLVAGIYTTEVVAGSTRFFRTIVKE